MNTGLTTSARHTIGVDLGDKRSHVCVLDAEGQITSELTISTTPTAFRKYFIAVPSGTIHYLWRAVDQNGVVIDILVQARRDRLRSYSAALPRVLPKVKHKRGYWLNNRADNSHQPSRERERRMRRFKSPEQAQQFLSIYSSVSSHFRPRRHRITAARYRTIRRQRFQQWNTAVQARALQMP
jgi:hypothetical protein